MTAQSMKITLGVFLVLCFAKPASATSVKFQVDMSVQTAVSAFNPATDTAEVRGDFNAWAGGFVLTNDVITPSIYSGTYNCTNVPGSPLGYKFVRISGGNAYWENDLTPSTGNNRTFNLSATTQILPLVYFNDLTPSPPPATQPITFQVDMTVQTTNGNFNPLTDSLVVRGTFQSPNQWTGGVAFTNSPANTNLYSQAFDDGNYPGTQEAYKFVIVHGGGDQWETVVNRSFTLQTNGQTFPVVSFNNQPGTSVPVSFQVDMSVFVASGSFNPAADTVQAWGTFESPNQWAGTLTLTNSPDNTNLFTGVYLDTYAAGTVEQFKFTYNSASTGFHWEQLNNPAFNDNRTYTSQAGGQVLPAVYFGDLEFSDVLPADTMVTFRVSMTNAVGTDGHVFNPGLDYVYINGDFLGWWNWGSFAPGQYIMTNDPLGSELYSITLLVPKWNPVALTYKYGINGLDDEAPFRANHVRDVRATGSYSMPLDTFGAPQVEPVAGSLAVRLTAPRAIVVSWNGRPGMHLQSRPSLTAGSWQDVANTDGQSSASFTGISGNLFFRLIKP